MNLRNRSKKRKQHEVSEGKPNKKQKIQYFSNNTPTFLANREKKHETSHKTEGALIGDGLRIARSNIVGAGNGLFATKSFNKNEIITEVCGPVLSRKEALAKETKTHLKSLSYHAIIDGLKNPSKAEGLGGGSFANDAKDKNLNNSKFVTDNLQTRCFLRAIRPINENEEILVSYGKTYWKMHL